MRTELDIWLIKRPGSYDEFHGFVIVAGSEKEAREMAASEAKRVADRTPGEDDWYSHQFLDPDKSTCERVTTDSARIVLSDFYEP